MAQPKRLGDIQLSKTVFFLCDMQERFRPVIKYFNDIVEVTKRLTNATRVLDIPLIVTEQRSGIDGYPYVLEFYRDEQRSENDGYDAEDCGFEVGKYPKGLGSTVPELDISNAVCTVPKTKFSMVLPEVEGTLKTLCDGNVEHIVLFGIETHVCIQQTVIDLLKQGFEVHVIADACSSRSQMDRMFALERFRHMGATVTTSEAVLLQLVGDKDHPKFKDIQALIKVSAPDSGLVSSL